MPATTAVPGDTLLEAVVTAPELSQRRVMKRLALGADGRRTSDDWLQILVTVVVLGGCFLFTFLALHPSKLFLNTMPAGGDMGAHVWAPWFLKNHLFPHGRISGWAPDWYDGFPALTYYFPGPYLVIALLSYVIPYGIAFKLVSVSGVLALPFAAYGFGRMTGMRFPGPQLLAVATVPFLFDRYFTIWGGNIASTLAGEFSFSISLSLALLFIGVFSVSMRTGKYRWLAALLLAGTLFSHLLPTFFAVAGAVLVWLLQPGRRRLWRGFAIGVLGFGVTAWWLLPFAVRIGYSNDMGWERSTAFMKGLFPFLCNSHKTDASVNCPAFNVVRPYTMHLEVVVALAAAGVIGGLILRRRTTLLITGLGLVFAGLFRFMPQGTLWNARMLPFWYLMLYFAAATCLAESALAVGVLLGRVPRRASLSPSGSGPDLAYAPIARANPEHDRQLVGVGGGSHLAAGVDWPADDGWDEVWDPPTGAPVAVADPGSPDAPGSDPAEPAAGGSGPPDDDDVWDDWRDDGPGGEAELVPSRWPALVAPVVIMLFVLAFVGQAIPDFQGFFNDVLGHYGIGGASERAAVNANFDSSWANWNYSGYQEKASYPEYRDVVLTMAHVGQQYGCGRAMWEYEPEEDRFGTPMALMLLPLWTNECIGSEEGLFFESSATVPYHFLDQSELSQNPSRAMRDLPYRAFNIVDGIQHMQLLGVRYYMAISPASQTAARSLTTGPNPMLRLVAQTGDHQVSYTAAGSTADQARHWEIYEILSENAPVEQVSGLSYLPAVMQGVSTTGRGWINTVLPWYQDASQWPVELAASGPANWPRVKGASANPPHIAVTPAVVSNVKTSDDRISFDVDHTGTPVLVKTSYFPNWQATGADGPWRVAPNLMVVVPTSRHVSLHYGFTPVDNAGRVITVAALAGVGVLWWRERSPGGEGAVLVGDDAGSAGDDVGGDDPTGGPDGPPEDEPVDGPSPWAGDTPEPEETPVAPAGGVVAPAAAPVAPAGNGPSGWTGDAAAPPAAPARTTGMPVGDAPGDGPAAPEATLPGADGAAAEAGTDGAAPATPPEG